jgi:hypothetical protein
MPILPSSYSSSSTSRSPTRSDARPSTPLLSDRGTGKEDGLEVPSYSRTTPLRHPRDLSCESMDELEHSVGIELHSGIDSPGTGPSSGSRRGRMRSMDELSTRGARTAEEVQQVW